MLLVPLLAAIGVTLQHPIPTPEVPGPSCSAPVRPMAPGAPVIYSFTEDAGPDESFLLVGERLTSEVAAWGAYPESPGGRELRPKVQFVKDGTLAATWPEHAFDGPFIFWVKNEAGWSEPVVVNAPSPWWCSPDAAAPGSTLRVFGRNLARRPDFARAFVYLAQPGKPGVWLTVAKTGKYELQVQLPERLREGGYQLWVHAGRGGDWGWGGPLPLAVQRPPSASRRSATVRDGDVQAAVGRMARRGGGIVNVPEGVFNLRGTLVVPAKVTVRGAGRNKTTLQSPSDLSFPLARIYKSGWNQGPAGVHSQGDTMAYRVTFPAGGTWSVWLRYATEMSPYKQPGVSKNMVLAADGGTPVPLDNLPNTGSFGTFQWSRSATIEVSAGPHELVWKNVKGGGIHIDAFVFALEPGFAPTNTLFPKSGEKVVVLQGEDVIRFETKEGRLPHSDGAAVWLAGDGAGITDLTVCGTPRTNLGVAVRSAEYPRWISGCRVERVAVRDCEGKQAENCGVRLFNADHAVMCENELWGRAPLHLSGVRQCQFLSNRLVGVTRWGGNSEAYILGRNDVVHQCIIEDNVCACPPGAEAGGPTGRRLIWLSTGRGSVDLNWIARNREDKARFGGVAGTDQNVGEMILFEACERIAFHGPLAGATQQSVALPAKLPPTPDNRLGSVKREQLAHDAAGNETPFWPPDLDDGTGEPPVTEYFVTVLKGRGLGQTRKVVARTNETYHLDRPWRIAPEAGGLVVVHTAYHRNHIIDNRCVDGMTGIQLWIACIENILSGNQVERQRKPGLYLYGNCTTLASSMPCTWNRGIGPLYFNHIEGTRATETSCGALVISGEMGALPVEFPRCLGNVLRHNSFARNRTDGVLLTGSRPAGEQRPTSVVLGTIVEFNVVRDALVGYHAATSADASLFRRNHAYFWYPVSPPAEGKRPPVAFLIDDEGATAAIEQNSIEGIHGTYDGVITQEQRAPKTKPAGK